MLTIRNFRHADIAAGMRLKGLAGWNQTEADWRRAIELEPDGCYAGIYDGIVVATLATCIFGRVAWVAMVLTDPSHRGRGFASALLRHALDQLKARGVETVRLDATALGRPVYEKFGFTVDYELDRWAGEVPRIVPSYQQADLSLRPCRTTDVPAMVELDQTISGCNRAKLFSYLLSDSQNHGWIAERQGSLIGYALQRPGEHAVQIGPLAAQSATSADAVLRQSLAACRLHQVFVDVPRGNSSFAPFLTDVGLGVQRTFLRMTLGRKLPEFGSLWWMSSGPEKG